MATAPKALSPRSATILRLLAAGHSYDQVLAVDPALTYLDIFAAAREALEIAESADDAYARRLAAIRERHPRAYAPWSDEEDAQLRRLVEAGQTVDDISNRLQRQRGAITSRIQRLQLQTQGSGPTERPLHNVMEFYGRGRESWDGTDAQEYVNRLREEWDHRP